MSHDHHMMGHDGHDMHAHGASMETTTMHDHGSMTTGHDHGSMSNDSMMMHVFLKAFLIMSKMETNNLEFLSQMSFYADYKAVVLFKEWDIQTVGAMVGSCIGIFLLAILYEGLKYFR